MDSRGSNRNDLEFNNMEQNEEENFINLGINQNIGNINEQYDDINITGISQINNTISDANININQNRKEKEKENNITKGKTKTKTHFNIITKSKTLPTRREIIDKVCETTTLFDLVINNKTLKQVVDQKEEELKKEVNNQIIKINDNEIKEQENKIIKENIINKDETEEDNKNKNEIKENYNNECKNSFSSEEKENDVLFQLIEEDEDSIKKRASVINKILKVTDNLVDIPNFKIFDDSKFKECLNEDDVDYDDDFEKEEKK